MQRRLHCDTSDETRKMKIGQHLAVGLVSKKIPPPSNQLSRWGWRCPAQQTVYPWNVVKHYMTILTTKVLNRTPQPRCLPKHLKLQDAGIPWDKVCHGSTDFSFENPAIDPETIVRKTTTHYVQSAELYISVEFHIWSWACQAPNLESKSKGWEPTSGWGLGCLTAGNGVWIYIHTEANADGWRQCWGDTSCGAVSKSLFFVFVFWHWDTLVRTVLFYLVFFPTSHLFLWNFSTLPFGVGP